MDLTRTSSLYFKIYLNEEELAYVRAKGKGWLRRVVQHQMALSNGGGVRLGVWGVGEVPPKE